MASKLKTWLARVFGSAGVEQVKVVEDPKDPRDNFLRQIFGDKPTDFITGLHTFARERWQQIDEYDQMLRDGVTLAAVNLIVEDATQIDADTNQVAWVTSVDNPDFAKEMNAFLTDRFHVNDIIYSIAYNVVAYGECFLNTHYADRDGYLRHFHLSDYFMVEEPKRVSHLYKYGVPLGYIRRTQVADGQYAYMRESESLLPEKSYIHFINDKGLKEYLSSGSSEAEPDELYIGYGSSLLEGAKYYYPQRQLLDDLILLSRLTRSSKYNLFKVEVGQATSQDTARMIREVKTAVQQRQEVSVSNQVFSSRNSPLLSGGNVYFPVRNGLGGVEVQQIADDPNVSSLKDIDYFNSNYYSALGVPQSFLGQTGDLPSGLGDSTLTQLDIRYARLVKRVQRVLKNGIRDLIIWKCLIDDVLPPQFEVNMAHILTAEDDRRSKIVADSAQRVRDLFDLLQLVDPEILQKADRNKLLYFLFQSLGRDADTYAIFNPETESEGGDEEPEAGPEAGPEESDRRFDVEPGLDEPEAGAEEIPEI